MMNEIEFQFYIFISEIDSLANLVQGEMAGLIFTE